MLRVFYSILFMLFLSFTLLVAVPDVFADAQPTQAAREAGFHNILHTNSIVRADGSSAPLVTTSRLQFMGGDGHLRVSSYNIQAIDQNLRLTATDASQIIFSTGGQQRMLIHSNGRVRINERLGIGIVNSWPAHPLHVVGTARIEGQLRPDTLCLNNVCHNEWPTGTGGLTGSGSANRLAIWSSDGTSLTQNNRIRTDSNGLVLFGSDDEFLRVTPYVISSQGQHLRLQSEQSILFSTQGTTRMQIQGGTGRVNMPVSLSLGPNTQGTWAMHNTTLEIGGKSYSHNDMHFEEIGTGVVLRSPNGLCYRITVDTTGALQTEPAGCIAHGSIVQPPIPPNNVHIEGIYRTVNDVFVRVYWDPLPSQYFIDEYILDFGVFGAVVVPATSLEGDRHAAVIELNGAFNRGDVLTVNISAQNILGISSASSASYAVQFSSVNRNQQGGGSVRVYCSYESLSIGCYNPVIWSYSESRPANLFYGSPGDSQTHANVFCQQVTGLQYASTPLQSSTENTLYARPITDTHWNVFTDLAELDVIPQLACSNNVNTPPPSVPGGGGPLLGCMIEGIFVKGAYFSGGDNSAVCEEYRLINEMQ